MEIRGLAKCKTFRRYAIVYCEIIALCVGKYFGKSRSLTGWICLISTLTARRFERYGFLYLQSQAEYGLPFVYYIVTEEPCHKIHTVQIRHFGGVYAGFVGAAFVTHKVKDRVIRFECVCAYVMPKTEAFGIGHKPTHPGIVGIREETVDSHCRYDAYRCHVVSFLCYTAKEKSAMSTHSDSGSGKTVRRIRNTTLCDTHSISITQ